ncbi:MAG: ATP synthase F0 subunit C [Novipirellula sp. JB048]
MFDYALILAQEVAQEPLNIGRMGVGIGMGLVILGAGFGIGRIGCAAVDATARQPEASGAISTQMLISAALIEGATVIALILMLILG